MPDLLNHLTSLKANLTLILAKVDTNGAVGVVVDSREDPGKVNGWEDPDPLLRSSLPKSTISSR
jgi:hypothetical protein